MIKGIVAIGCLLSLAVCTMFQCTISDTGLNSGNSSQTPNALVGMLYEPDGKTPAHGVSVKIRPKNSLALSGGNNNPSNDFDTSSTVTGSSGYFSFDTSLSAGIYVIEALSGNNALFIDSIQIVKNAETDTLPPSKLQPAGAIRGTVSLIGGGDPSEVYILAFGIDRFAQVKHDGTFTFPSFGEGTYNLRFITSVLGYKTFDTLNIEVVSAETTDIGRITLPYTGTPIPTGIKSFYDSSSQTIIVSWNRSDPSITKGYLFSRKFIWGDITSITSTIITDTFYTEKVDLTKKYYWECQIAGIDSNGIDGAQSDTIIFQWSQDTLIEASQSILMQQISNSSGITKDVYDNFWIADYEAGKVYVYDKNGHLKNSWLAEISKSDSFPFSATNSYMLCVDNNKNVYLENADQKSIVKYDSTGKLVGTLQVSSESKTIDICLDKDGNMYTYSYNRFLPNLWIRKYDQEFSFIDSSMNLITLTWDHRNFEIKNDVIYCTGACKSVPDTIQHIIPQRFSINESKIGNLKAVMIVSVESTVDSQGIIYGVDSPKNLWVSDVASLHQSNFAVKPDIPSDFNFIKGIYIMSDGSIALCLYNSNSRSYAVYFLRRS